MFFTVEELDKTNVAFSYLDALYNFYFPFILNYINSNASWTEVGPAAREFYLKNLPISRLTLREFIDVRSSNVIF